MTALGNHLSDMQTRAAQVVALSRALEAVLTCPPNATIAPALAAAIADAGDELNGGLDSANLPEGCA